MSDEENTSHLAEEQWNRERKLLFGKRAAQDGGASASNDEGVRDSRVSTALKWFWGLVGAGIAGSVLLAAQNLYQLNLTVARAIDADSNRDKVILDHEQRLRQLERDVNTMAGKNLRGVESVDGQ